MLSVLIGSIPFIILLVFLTIWIYAFVYNHNIIQTSGRLHILPSQINEYIQAHLIHKYNLRIIDVKVSEDDFDGGKVKHNSISHETSRKNDIIGIIFSITIALGTLLIVLMMCELADFYNVKVRIVLFKFVIDTLVFILTLFQPCMIISLCICQDLVPYRNQQYTRLVISLALLVGWLYLLHKAGEISPNFSVSETSGQSSKSLIEKKINEVAIGGITALAVLSGIGSASTPYKLFFQGKANILKLDTFNNFHASKEISEAEINDLIQSFNNTCLLLLKRKNELSKIHLSTGGTIYNQPNHSTDNVLLHGGLKKNKFGGIMHKVQSFASLSNLSLSTENLEEHEVSMEIDGLLSLKSRIYDDIVNMISDYLLQQQQSVSRQERFHKLMKYANYAFAMYCIYRIVNVLFVRMPYLVFYAANDVSDQHTNVIVVSDDPQDIQTSNTKDALAITLAKLILSLTSLPIAETQLVNQISFILSGSLFICSFSNVLITFKSFSKLMPTTSGFVKNSLKHLVISEALGVYIIATALLIRTNLPTTLSHQISKILSLSGSGSTNPTISIKEVEFIDAWFDKVFAISCLATIVLLIAKRYFDSDEPSDYDEELILETNSFKTA